MSVFAPLQHLHPGWFTLVMGWIGLAMAWTRAAALMGPQALWVARVAGAVAFALFTVLAIASAWRGRRFGQAWRDDLAHPVRHAFVAAIPVSMLLLGTWLSWHAAPLVSRGVTAAGMLLTLAEVLWLMGSAGQLLATVWVLQRWWRKGGGLGLVTPVHLIPIVGNVLTPLGGVALGHETWSLLQFGLGLILWPVWSAMMWRRARQGPALPDRIAPALFIQVAPPAVIGIALAALGAAALWSWLAWALSSALLAGLVFTQGRRLLSQPFGLPYWGMSFPMTAWASLSMWLFTTPALPVVWHTAAVATLALASGVILMLSSSTWRGLRQGTLLVAEPAMPPAAAVKT